MLVGTRVLQLTTDTGVVEVPVRIFQRNLESLTLTSAPSLVFRYIGFGGRMFAVPLVVPHTGWVRYWNTADTVLP